MGNGLTLRNIDKTDSLTIWRWRNHPEVRRHCFHSSIIPWQAHKNWLDAKLKDPNAKIYIARYKKDKVGVIRFDIESRAVKVSVNLNPLFFGRGFGSKIIRAGTEKFYRKTKIVKPIIAEIKKDNIVSEKAFLKASYSLKRTDHKTLTYQWRNKCLQKRSRLN